MINDVLLNKVASIERCLARINEEFNKNPETWKSNFTVQDSILLNLQRACDASINVANIIISERKLGIPQSSRDSFDLLLNNGILDETLATKMKHMVGFRNLAVHEYQTLNMDVIESIIQNHLVDFQHFTTTILKLKLP
jgi:uncharacterized protein YutE (UPF0331/DUF86 family)